MTILDTIDVARWRRKAARSTQIDWERRRAYQACLKAEEALEVAGLNAEAAQVRQIRRAL